MAESNIIKTKPNFIDGLNKFNKLLTRNSFDADSIRIIIDKYGFDGFLIRRLISYVYNYPWVLTYLNKYLNYLGVASCDLMEYIKTFRYILLCNGILDTRRFYYLKSSAEKNDIQKKIIDLLDKYFSEIFDLNLNYKELLFYYNLYLNGIITNQDIYEIDLLINNNSKTINLPDFKPDLEKNKPVSVNTLIKRFSESSRGIDFINNEIYKRKNENCESCRYFGREIVPFDGNIIDINNVDVLIVNLNPDLNDLKEKRTFRENSIIRQNISLFPKNVYWLLINLSPCVFKSKSELGKDIDEIKEHLIGCNKIVFDFIQQNIKPKLTILIGREVESVFLPSIEFEETLGRLTNNKFISALHPNSMKQVKSQINGKKSWESVQHVISDFFTSSNDDKSIQTISKEENNQQQNQVVIEKIKKNDQLLLLDVKEIEGGKSVLLIFTDEEGNKHYEKKRNITTGYIKESKFKNCSVLTDSVDVEFTMTKMEKIKLTKLLREKMAKLKGN